DVAAVATYIRQLGENDAGVVSTEQVSAVRAADEGRTRPWTAAELRAAGPVSAPAPAGDEPAAPDDTTGGAPTPGGGGCHNLQSPPATPPHTRGWWRRSSPAANARSSLSRSLPCSMTRAGWRTHSTPSTPRARHATWWRWWCPKRPQGDSTRTHAE